MQTDFFELPVEDQHKECIEVETDYDRGVMDERKRWEAKRCEMCFYSRVVIGGFVCDSEDSIFYEVENDSYCRHHQPKGSE